MAELRSEYESKTHSLLSEKEQMLETVRETENIQRQMQLL